MAGKSVQITVGEDVSTATLGDVKVEVSTSSDVTVYTDKGVQARAADNGEAASTEGTQVNVGKDFNTVALNGATIALGANGNVTVYTNGTVSLAAPANDSAAPAATAAEPNVGDVMPEGHAHAGRIYLGPSASTGRPLYAASEDSGVYKWREAMDFAARQNNGASVPTQAELNQLYKARDTGALKGTFNLTGSGPAGWYWSSTEDRDATGYARHLDFSVGFQCWDYKVYRSSLRLVWS